MHERADRLAALVSVDRELEHEFEARLVESSTLAYRVAFSVLRRREDAEDVAQEAFAKAYRRFHQLRDRERFRAWLVRMTWRLALDRQRADRRRLAREDRAGRSAATGNGALARIGEEPHLQTRAQRSGRVAARGGEGADLQVRLEHQERAEHLWRAIDALSEKLRVVVVLASIQEHDIKEVATLLGLPEGTVKSRLFDARRQLKEALAWMADNLAR
jgi:RNA polymerase sigma-70 factor (ECF subfamily)